MFELSERGQEYRAKLLTFMDEHVYPIEATYQEQLDAVLLSHSTTPDRTARLTDPAAPDPAPVLLADVDAGVVGAVHAGRPGMVAGVVPAAVRRMRDLGAERIVAAVGPSVCGRCY